MKQIFLTITLFSILAVLPVLAQTDTYATNVITKKDGVAFENIAPKQRFAFIIKGNSPLVKKLESATFQVSAEGLTFLVMFTKKSEFVVVAKDNSDAVILERWRKFDIGGTETEIEEKLKVAETGAEKLPVFDFRPNSNQVFVDSIYYILPVPFPDGKARIFLQSVVVGDVIITIGANFEAEKNVKVRKFFKDTLRTLSILEPETEKKAVAPKTKPSKTKTKTKKKLN